jgi:hypothetical protein
MPNGFFVLKLRSLSWGRYALTHGDRELHADGMRTARGACLLLFFQPTQALFINTSRLVFRGLPSHLFFASLGDLQKALGRGAVLFLRR